MKYFGIGLNKTGTKTLGECFRLLGFNNKSYDLQLLKSFKTGNLDEVFQTCDNFDSFEDWPWPLMYKELDRYYPESKYILTLRKDPETWYISLCRHAVLTGPTEARKLVYGYAMPKDHKDQLIHFYLKHQEDVQKYFKQQDGKLLVVSWENGDGWKEICNFLGILDIPRQAFPYINKSNLNSFSV